MIRHVIQSIETYRANKAQLAELMALDGLTLRDIGLDRSEIESALENRGNERRNGSMLPCPAPSSGSLSKVVHQNTDCAIRSCSTPMPM